MKKKKLILSACVLSALATLALAPGLATDRSAKADAVALADEQNVIRKSDGSSLSDNDRELQWTFGDDDIISYTFRPEHGDTVYYTVSADNGGGDEFAVVYIGDTAMLYEANDGVVDTEKPFGVNSLNAYLKTLKAGKYSLAVNVPSGVAPSSHTHWWDSAAGNVGCGISYSAVAFNVDLTVAAYEIAASNLGESDSVDPNVTVRYNIKTPEVLYTGEANNLPQIELTLSVDGGTLILEQDADYTISSESIDVGNADLTIVGMGGLTGEVTVHNAYTIAKGENSIDDVYVVRWKYGEYDRNVNLFTANAKWGGDDLYYSITTELIDPANPTAAAYVDGLDEIRLTDGKVSPQVERRLNELDAKQKYYLYATVAGDDNYYSQQAYTQFDVVEVTNTWKTIPNVVGWEWHGFDSNVNVINAAPAFGDAVEFSVYTKDGEEYTPIDFGGEDSFELDDGNIPSVVAVVLSELDAGTYYLFASVISDTDNYSSINETFSAEALVPFRVSQATNTWTLIPNISNWTYGGYNPEVNAISAASAHGSSGIKYRIYKQNADGIGLLNFGGTTSFTVGVGGALPSVVTEGLKALGVGKYYLRAEVAATDNYTGLQEVVADFSQLPSFEVIKAENYWSVAPAIDAWAKGEYSNDDNLPVAAAHYGAARIVIVDVDDEDNVIYDSENNINLLSGAKVGAYLLTATVAGTDNYGGLSFDTIFHVFVPKTAKVGIAWWLVLIIVVCSLGVLVFIFWLLHDKGVLQMLSRKAIVAMRTKATMDATIAAVRANKVAEEARESVRLAEELDRLEAERAEAEQNDSDDDGDAILLERDEQTGIATFVRYQRPFAIKLIQAPDEAKDYYSRLKNVLLSYKKVKSKVSKGYDSYHRGRTQLAKLVVRGKTLCLYLALDPDDYAESKYKVERSESKKFADVPCLYRIKNARRLGYAEELIKALCDKHGIAQGEIGNDNFRPPYETTESLLEQGLIKKIIYKRKIGSSANDNKGEGVTDKTVDATDEAAAATDGETAGEQGAERSDPPAQPAADEQTPAAEQPTERSTDVSANDQATTTKSRRKK